MHQTKYRGIITEGRIIDVSSLGAGLLGYFAIASNERLHCARHYIIF